MPSVLRFDPATNKVDFQLRVDRDGKAIVRFKDSAGDPIAQTGKYFEFIVKKIAGSTTLVEWNTDDGSIIITDGNGTDDQIEIIIEQADTTGLKTDTYYCELNVNDSDGFRTYIATSCYITNGSYNEPV